MVLAAGAINRTETRKGQAVVTTETKASRRLTSAVAIPEMPLAVQLHLGVVAAGETTIPRTEAAHISGIENFSLETCTIYFGGGHCVRSAMSHTLLPVV